MTRVRLCFHDRCFDGTASAALFYRFYREKFDPAAEFGFTGMTHRASQPWTPGLFDGDENAIVDFKYSNSPKVTWWFDHHQSAFLTPADAEHFRSHPGPHMFYEPDYKSCTKLIATVAREKFAFDTKPLEELIHWGDIIDGAQYPTPESAVELTEPATQLALVIEAAPEDGLPARIIPELAYRPLSEMVKLPLVAKHLSALLDASHSSQASFSAYAAASSPPTSHVILAVTASLAGADDALRGYAAAVEEWREHLKGLKPELGAALMSGINPGPISSALRYLCALKPFG